MKKIIYYFSKLFTTIRKIFSISKIRRFGFVISFYGFLSFLMHRSDSKLNHWFIYRKDILVQQYIYDNYAQLIENYKDKK